MTVLVELILTESTEDVTDTALVLPNNTTHSNSTDTSIPVTLHRYVNHTPLLDYQDDALSCGITMASLRTVKWTQCGYKMKHSSHDRDSGVYFNTGCQETRQIHHSVDSSNNNTSFMSTDTTPSNNNSNGSDSHNTTTIATTTTTNNATTTPSSTNIIINHNYYTTTTTTTTISDNNSLWHSAVYELVCTRPELCEEIFIWCWLLILRVAKFPMRICARRV